MRWNEMTSQEFKEAVTRSGGVCLLPLGVMEKHGAHLPVGIDYMNAWHSADLAARHEPAIVFPPCYIGSISEAKHCPGTFSLSTKLLYEFLDEACAEIARNGLKKIILVNAHGGNQSWLAQFLRMQNEKERDYMIYLLYLWSLKKTEKARSDVVLRSGDFGGHGGAGETATALYLFPELVKMDKILPPEEGKSLKRLKHLDECFVRTPVNYYANHPGAIGGYGGGATGADGEEICKAVTEDLCDIIRRVKADNASMELYRNFFKCARRKQDKPG